MAYDMIPSRRPLVAAPAILALSALLGGCIINTQPPQTQAAQARVVNGGGADHPQGGSQGPILRGALSGLRQRVEYFYGLHPDCTSSGVATAHVVTPPAHGTVTFAEAEEYPNFPPNNQRYDCNKQKSPALDVYYTSTGDYKGPDEFTIEVLYPAGVIATRRFVMTVE